MNLRSASISPQTAMVKPLWTSLIGPPWLISLVIYAAVAAVRFIALLSPYSLQELFFLQTLAMWSLPFVVLTPEGRRQIGLTGKAVSRLSIFLCVVAGAACALTFFELGMAIYGDSPENWCISIRSYLHFDEMRGLMSPLSLFALYALPAIFLNPIGEEILFRGFIQTAVGQRFRPITGWLVNVILFGVIYLSLHGIWRDAGGFHVRLVSAALAVFLMACVGGVFTLCRTFTESLWTAMFAHAAFNLALLGAAIHRFVR